jgi:hypothetical protein
MNQHLEGSINDIKAGQEKFKEAATAATGNTEEQDAAEKEAFGDLGTVLFNQITETSIGIIQTPEIEESLLTIATNMNMDQASIAALINIIAISMTNSAHQAILFYDDLLKKELTKQMDNVGHHINLGKTDSEAFKSVLQIHQKRIDEISNILQMNNLKKENNFDQEPK